MFQKNAQPNEHHSAFIFFAARTITKPFQKDQKKLCLAGYQNKAFLGRLQTNARVPFSWFDLDPE